MPLLLVGAVVSVLVVVVVVVVDDDDEDDHVADEPVQVTLRLGGHDAVSSLPSHWQVPCKGLSLIHI